MKSFLKLAAALAFVAAPLGASALADPADSNAPDNRLVIVDGNSGQVIYDDGYDDLFCVTRLHRWHDEWGHRHRYRSMRCR